MLKIGKESKRFLGIYLLLWIGILLGIIFKVYNFSIIMFMFAVLNSIYVISWIKNGWLKD